MKKILLFIDSFLNSITMYKLVLYSLIILAVQSILFSYLGVLSFNGTFVVISLAVLFLTCYAVNFFWAKVLKVAINFESATITSFILFFILSPIAAFSDIKLLVLAGGIAMSSKYLFAIHKKHLFNPAAIATVLLGLFTTGFISWWVGSAVLIPSTVILGFLILRKIRRFTLFLPFLVSSLLAICVMSSLAGISILSVLPQLLTSWPILFFGTIMLTEPLTTPPTKKLRIVYGIIVGILFGSQFQIGPFYSTPQLALVLGNIFSYLVSPKERLILTLKEKVKLAPSLYEFIFAVDQKFHFVAGQYMEFTIPQSWPDSRGNRRYFTISSSPTEPNLEIGLKFYERSSSFKTALLSYKKGEKITASQLAGDFTLPANKNQKLVFIAGGIGVTPFRSMIKYLIDSNEKRDIVLFFVNKVADEVIYDDVFEQAKKTLGIRVVYTISDEAPKNWKGEVGRIDMNMIKKYVPDFMEREYYLSGPHAMVVAYEEVLYSVGIHSDKIMSDFFPGYT